MVICPKTAVTVLNAGRPGLILTILKRAAANEVMAELMCEMEQ
jgi:hypothetical protein